MRSLLTSLNTVAADEMQTILTVAEHLRSNLENEMERMKQAQRQYDELLARHDETLRLWATDKEKIRKQRDEIGRTKKKARHNLVIFFTFSFFIRVEYIVYHLNGRPFQTRHGVNETQRCYEIKWPNRKCIQCEKNSKPLKVL